LQQAITGAKVVPAAPNVSRGDVGPSVVQRQVSAEIDQLRGPAAEPVPLGNEGRAVPQKVTSPGQHPITVPASRAGASILAATEPVDTMPLTTKDVLPGGYLDRGAGILAQRGKTGRLNVANVGTEGLTDPGKTLYTGADGQGTNDWSKTERFAEGQRDAQNQRDQLERMQRSRFMSDATDPTITDPRAVAAGVRGLAILNAARSDETQGKTADMQHQIGKHQLAEAETLSALRQKAIGGDAGALKMLQALSGKSDKQTQLQIHDTEEPIDPNQPLMGNRKVAHTFNPSTGEFKPAQKADPMAQARAAIARGADPKAVNARLKALGHPEIK
jgi:hypothetical protein